jgi:hypothetical protein
MKRILMIGLYVLSSLAAAETAPLSINLAPAAENPALPKMGDTLHFRSVIRNTGPQAVEGLVAWISLVEVTPGNEQPMDLEDWSALKAVTGAQLDRSGELETDWPMRLIQDGDYRVVISATDRAHRAVYTSTMLQFHVASKPVVESSRILPVALGVPLLIAGWLVFSRFRHGRSCG